MTTQERFWSKVYVTEFNECWLWAARVRPDGYGDFCRDGKQALAHRYSYEMVNGPIPVGLQLDHLCHTRPCVNPSHLEAVTARENIQRGLSGYFQASKTHCPSGHAYKGNTYVRGNRERMCRICALLQNERHRARRAVAQRSVGSLRNVRPRRAQQPPPSAGRGAAVMTCACSPACLLLGWCRWRQ